MREIEARTGRDLDDLLRELAYERHMTHAGIARELGVRPGTVSYWIVTRGLARYQLRAAAQAEHDR